MELCIVGMVHAPVDAPPTGVPMIGVRDVVSELSVGASRAPWSKAVPEKILLSDSQGRELAISLQTNRQICSVIILFIEPGLEFGVDVEVRVARALDE